MSKRKRVRQGYWSHIKQNVQRNQTAIAHHITSHHTSIQLMQMYRLCFSLSRLESYTIKKACFCIFLCCCMTLCGCVNQLVSHFVNTHMDTSHQLHSVFFFFSFFVIVIWVVVVAIAVVWMQERNRTKWIHQFCEWHTEYAYSFISTTGGLYTFEINVYHAFISFTRFTYVHSGSSHQSHNMWTLLLAVIYHIRNVKQSIKKNRI